MMDDSLQNQDFGTGSSQSGGGDNYHSSGTGHGDDGHAGDGYGSGVGYSYTGNGLRNDRSDGARSPDL